MNHQANEWKSVCTASVGCFSMFWRKIIPVLIACSSVLASAAPSQQEPPSNSPTAVPLTALPIKEARETVIPIDQFQFGVGTVKGTYATGFCLDSECRFVGTNYHVAKSVRLRNIEGERVKNIYLATGPDDVGTSIIPAGKRDLTVFNVLRDLAVLELQHPLRHRHGIAFSLRDLQAGQEVDIYAYPKEPKNPIRELRQFTARFKGRTDEGILYFTYSPSDNGPIRGGSSGAIVVDRESHQIVGILSGFVSEAMVFAVPVQSLAELIIRVRPYLAQVLFPSTQGISPVAADFYPEFAPSPAGNLEHRTEEPPAVKLLRSKAQALSDSMRDFIAVQTFSWGEGRFEPVAQAAYQVQIVNGNQRFRSYPDGKKLFRDVPDPGLTTRMTSGGEWSELPGMVGTELSLKIHQAPDVVLNERRMKVFQYQGRVEDNICKFQDVWDFVLFAIKKDFTLDCYGEVWTDEETNLLRISEHYKLLGKWKDYEGVVAYGWIQRAGKPRLVPLTISTQATYRGKVYWCRGQFMDYSMFAVQGRIVAERDE